MKRILVLFALIVVAGCHAGGDRPREVAAPQPSAESAAPVASEAPQDARISKAGEAPDASSPPRAAIPATDEPKVESDPRVAVISQAAGRTKAGGPLPGPCFDPERHARIVEQLPQDSHLERRGMDLDGDGAEDTLIVGDARGFSSTMHLYVMRGTCGYHVGDLVGPFAPPKPLRSAHGGCSICGRPT